MNKVVCLDFDGVIIHSSEVQRCAFSESYHWATGKTANEELLQNFFSHSGDSLENIFNKMHLPLEMIGTYRQVSIARSDKVKLHPGMKELLAELRNQDILCALCTGKDRERTIIILKNLKIYDYFNEIICSDDVVNPKPNPESLNILMKRFDVSKDHIVMIGDANNDIKCAKSAGVTSIGVTWGDVPRDLLLQDNPDYVADQVSELKTAIESALDILIRKKMIFNDFVVAEDVCNMKCEYCLTQTSQFKKEHEVEGAQTRKLSELTYQEGSQFKQRIDNIQDKLLSDLDIAVLKISGGEIMMLPKIEEYILLQAKKYKMVQVLTNGVLLKEEQLIRFKNQKNICLQISLDHNTMEGNSYRTKDEKILNRILNNIDLAHSIGISVEINCVLTDKNTKILDSFLEYLLKYDKGVIVYPFPVRGLERSKYYMKEEQIASIQNILDHYERYQNILAPKSYMKYLLDFLKTGKRKVRCYLPKIAVGVFDDGTITPCPNYWFNSLGCVLDEKQEATGKVGSDFIYDVLCGERNRFKECTSCFTPWETFNLYKEGVLTVEELTKAPSYCFDGVADYIKNI